jgi:hypothetical protein
VNNIYRYIKLYDIKRTENDDDRGSSSKHSDFDFRSNPIWISMSFQYYIDSRYGTQLRYRRYALSRGRVSWYHGIMVSWYHLSAMMYPKTDYSYRCLNVTDDL